MKFEKNRMFGAYRFTLVFLLLFALFSCGSNEGQIGIEEKAYPVEVKILRQTENAREIEYYGIASSNIINNSFLTGGRVQRIFVRKGQFVRKGTKLIQLEDNAYQLALNAAKQQEIQAKSAFLEAKAFYEKLENAANTGGIANTELEKAQLDRNVKEQDWEQSKINLEAKKDDLQQTTLFTKTEGIVSDIIPKVGELVDAGAETVIVQGKGIYAETAIAQKDLKYIKTGTISFIEINGQRLKGAVAAIAGLPDMQTFRHTVKIEFAQNQLQDDVFIGQTLKVFFQSDTVKGFWLPINSVSNDGSDFVNVVENERLRKKKVQIMDFAGEMVRVTGLKDNELLITKGASSIREGLKVRIVNPKK